jgi:3-dehydroquinate synthase
VNSAKIEIRGANFCYAAHVDCGLIGQTGQLTREVVRGNRAAIVTDSNIPPPLVDAVATSLAAAGFHVMRILVPPGENSKSLREVERVCGEMSTLDRTSIVVGVGGGVVGDLSGFVAAVFHRGIPHVQIPTTLLAMVDSSIGGKTAVNLISGKNLVGVFHHPSLVIADVEALKTLPARELRQGYAEIVKHAIIRDAGMFRELQSANITDWTPLIRRNIEIKATIVSADARDISGERALLNFGHTVGHAIERVSDFRIPHGDCVSLGIVAACEISLKRAGLPTSQRDEVIALLRRLDLPTRLPPNISREKIADAVSRDKKFEGGEVRFVVTPRIGQAYISREVTIADLREAIAVL